MPAISNSLGEFFGEKMSYIEPDREWVEIEMKILDEMGRKWFLANPPKIWRLKKKPDNLFLEGMKKLLRDRLGYQFKIWMPFANRYMRDLISKKRRIIIHHWQVSENEKKIQNILGYRFFKYQKENWRRDIERIIGEIKEYENESMAR